MPPHLGNECFSIPKFFLMISLCISNFSLSRCQKWEKVPTLPRIDHTHSQKGPIAIQLFFFAHQTYGTLLGSLLWALDGGSNDDQLEHSFNEQRLIYLSFLNWHRLHLPYLNTIVIRRHICLDIGIKALDRYTYMWKKQKKKNISVFGMAKCTSYASTEMRWVDDVISKRIWTHQQRCLISQ